jgi:alpha-galactosidase
MNGGGPLDAWRKNDTPDRQGVTENLYVQGHLYFWDELRRRNPGLFIDSCASGGRRNDIETMRRAVPLLRSDFTGMPHFEGAAEGNQGHTYGLSFWLPFQGTGTEFSDKYSFRSFYLPSLNIQITAPQQAHAECTQIAPYILFGDYYPLTPYNRQLDQWIAWQFNRPKEGDGAVQAFRRPKSAVPDMKLMLRGLDSTARYSVKNLDTSDIVEISGKELMEEGLLITLHNQPDSALIVYRQLK